MAENNRAPDDDAIVVRVLKYDGTERRTWPARVAKRDGPLIVLDAVFDEEIQHDLLGTIPSGTTSKEYYWLDRWYNVFRFGERFYCNVTQPPKLEGGVLCYIDLDVDVLVDTDFSYKILDVENFEASSYPAEIQENARQAVEELIGRIETRSFPFNE